MNFSRARARFWPFKPYTPEQAVLRDATDLIRLWGAAAFSVAGTMSWQEDTGLIPTPSPGHWSRVKHEIGHRLGCQDDEPEADFAARPQLRSVYA